MVIVDIFLHSESALDLLTDIQHQLIPAIFITGSTDENLYRQVEDSQYGYLVKPFNKLTLFATIRLISPNQASSATPAREFLMVRTHKAQKKIMLHEILWLESSGNYTVVVTAYEKLAVKQSMRGLAEIMGDSFLRVHKGYCVNIARITHLKAHSVVINDVEIPVSYMRKSVLVEKLNAQRIFSGD